MAIEADSKLALAKRNALILAAASAFISACAPIAISLGGIIGDYLLDEDKSLATAPVTGFNIGVALGALPAAWIMRLIGRRYGFMGGALVSGLGGIIAATALFQLNFWLFAAGLMVVGIGAAFVQQYRFAAADGAPEAFKAQAISWVLIGGIFAAIIGPQTVIFARDLFAPTLFAGAYVGILVLSLIGFVILFWLRIPEHTVLLDDEPEEPARPLLEIISPTAFSNGTSMRCMLICLDVLHDDRCAAGDDWMRILHRYGDPRDSVARAGHVRPQFLYRQADCPFWPGKNRCDRIGDSDRLRDRSEPGPGTLEFLAGTDHAWRRLELWFHRCHCHGDANISVVGEEQGPGCARRHFVQFRCLQFVDVWSGSQFVWLDWNQHDHDPGSGCMPAFARHAGSQRTQKQAFGSLIFTTFV